MTREQKASAMRFVLGAVTGMGLTPILGLMLVVF
jgi:hypothetical protein